VNGFNPHDTKDVANGAGCLFAQIVALFKVGCGGAYLQDPSEIIYEEFNYFVDIGLNVDGEQTEINVMVQTGNETLFSGPPGEAYQYDGFELTKADLTTKTGVPNKFPAEDNPLMRNPFGVAPPTTLAPIASPFGAETPIFRFGGGRAPVDYTAIVWLTKEIVSGPMCCHEITGKICRSCQIFTFMLVQNRAKKTGEYPLAQLPVDVCKIVFRWLPDQRPKTYPPTPKDTVALFRECGPNVRVSTNSPLPQGAACGVEHCQKMWPHGSLFCIRPATTKGKSGNWTCQVHAVRPRPDLARNQHGISTKPRFPLNVGLFPK
jgi:hypothetical protein